MGGIAAEVADVFAGEMDSAELQLEIITATTHNVRQIMNDLFNFDLLV